MAKNRLLDLYAYIAVDHIHNSYPIRNPKKHLELINRLKEGDKLFIDGIGHLLCEYIVIDEYPYTNKGKDGLFQSIAICCHRI